MKTVCHIALALAFASIQGQVSGQAPIPQPGAGSTFRPIGTTQVISNDICGAHVNPCTEAFPRVDANTQDICGIKTVALTFDDGPDCGDDGKCTVGSTNTEKILDILEKYGVSASFFVNTATSINDFQDFGGPIASQPTKQSTIQRIVKDGHLLASHSATHPDFTRLTATQVEQQLADVESTLAPYTSNPIACFRAPFGAPYDNKPANPQALSIVAPVVSKHAVHIGWMNTGQDWACPYDAQCVTNYYKGFFAANYTGVITMHPVYSSTVSALDGLIQQALQGGYSFVSAEYYVEQKYGMNCAGVVSAFNQCSQYTNSQDFSNVMAVSEEFEAICPPLRVE